MSCAKPASDRSPLPPASSPAGATRSAARPTKRETHTRSSFLIPNDLLESARNAVFHLSGPPQMLSLADLVVGGIRREVARLEKRHNRGRPFTPRTRALRGGRRVGV